MAVEVKNYSTEDKDQILREVKDTGNMALVARNRGIAYQTVVSWVGSQWRAPSRKPRQALKQLEAKLKDAELENPILKKLLKKTNQLWLTDGPSAPRS